MGELNERQQKILELVIQEYVNKPKPISSKILAKKLGLSSATLRNEMKELEKGKYLVQPHTSAGRIPTEKAYRLFIKSIKEKEIKLPVDIGKNPSEDISKDITQTLAEMSGGLAFSAIKEMNSFYQTGFSNLLKFPEFGDKDYFSEMAQTMEQFEKHFDDLFDKISENETEIFIGKDNPMSKTKRVSIIISKCKMPNDKHGVIGLLGPTRMKYDYNVSLINKLKEILEGFEL
jgi:transcriptional regulator of heat shock response